MSRVDRFSSRTNDGGPESVLSCIYFGVGVQLFPGSRFSEWDTDSVVSCL